MGYRDEQLALRLKTEAAEHRAAEADRRRLAAEAEIERLRIELAFARADPPYIGIAAARRVFLVALGLLAILTVLIGSAAVLRGASMPRSGLSAAPAPSPPMMVPIQDGPYFEPAALGDLHLLEKRELVMHPDARCTFVLRHGNDAPVALSAWMEPPRLHPPR
jgi:hypothetical protein